MTERKSGMRSERAVHYRHFVVLGDLPHSRGLTSLSVKLSLLNSF